MHQRYAPGLYKALVGKSESVKKAAPSPFCKVKKFKHTDDTRKEGRQILKNLFRCKLAGVEYEQAAYELEMNIRPKCASRLS